MAFVEDSDSGLNFAIMKSEMYASEGFLYDAFVIINKAIINRFSRMGFIKAILYLFKMVDACTTVRSKICLKNASIINDCYNDINRMTTLVRNESRMHFWAACIKICQFRSERHRPMNSRLENLLTARQHLRSTIDFRPDHILASYLFTMCDFAFQDRTGTQSYYAGDLKLPDDFYMQCVKEEPNCLLPFSFILAKLGFYVKEYFQVYHYVGIAMCVEAQTPFEKKVYIEVDALMDIMIKVMKLLLEEDKPLPKEDKPLPKEGKPLPKKGKLLPKKGKPLPKKGS